VHGQRYTAEKDTFLQQVGRDWTKAPLKAGDRDFAGESTKQDVDWNAFIGGNESKLQGYA
jgi:hypothetical protein